MNRRPVALITGATSGIGYELAKLFALHRYDVVLVARNSNDLHRLQKEWEKEYGIDITCCPFDLSVSTAPDDICNVLAAEMIDIDVLVNNAGFGLYGTFAELPIADQLEMLQVNIVALTHLTRNILPRMLQRKSGKILNVASLAGFLPGPLMAVYYASKAYVLNFSVALAEEVRGTGITVTTLCPGPTATKFGKRAGITKTHLFQKMAWMDASTVAEIGFRGLMEGKAIVVPGMFNVLGSFLVRCLPRVTASKIVQMLHGLRA
ncbi:MAG: SDR family oxidoreductase [Bacteroidetes bacterium]|nr:SDR family oxidoreductase [Bacteroidota bacterium]